MQELNREFFRKMAYRGHAATRDQLVLQAFTENPKATKEERDQRVRELYSAEMRRRRSLGAGRKQGGETA